MKSTKDVIYSSCLHYNIIPYEFVHDLKTGAVKILDQKMNVIHEYNPQ